MTSCDMKYHLYLCGNKTNKCPKCSKYIRRAIYNYHLDNNCIDLSEDDTFDENYFIPDINDIETDDDVLIPCEFCKEQIKFHSFDYHSVLWINYNSLLTVSLFLEKLLPKSNSS